MVVLPNGQVPPDGKYDMKFSLWNIVSGGSEGANEKWEETHSVDNGVNLVKGRFSVQLGGITPFPADLFIKNPNIWLQVQVDLNKNGFEDSEIFLPRVPFTSAPYAFQADNAATADTATTATYATHATDVLRIVRDFVVDSGESITSGDVVSFINGKIRKGVNKIGYGPEQAFNSGITSRVFATALSDSKFVVAYQDDVNSDSGTAIVGTVSGSTISYGSGYVFNDAIPNYLSAAMLSDSKFVVAYSDLGNSNSGTAIVGTVFGSTISFGSEYVFNPADTIRFQTVALSDSKFVVAYRDGGNSNYGTAIVGTVLGSMINYGSEYVFRSVSTDRTTVIAFSDSKFAVAYQDDGINGYGMSVIGDFYEPFGIADATASDGQNLPVILHGISNHHSSLTTGTVYYGNTDGSLTRTRNAFRIGRAVSDTELLLELGR